SGPAATAAGGPGPRPCGPAGSAGRSADGLGPAAGHAIAAGLAPAGPGGAVGAAGPKADRTGAGSVAAGPEPGGPVLDAAGGRVAAPGIAGAGPIAATAARPARLGQQQADRWRRQWWGAGPQPLRRGRPQVPGQDLGRATRLVADTHHSGSEGPVRRRLRAPDQAL